jgi:hypothetical protein
MQDLPETLRVMNYLDQGGGVIREINHLELRLACLLMPKLSHRPEVSQA